MRCHRLCSTSTGPGRCAPARPRPHEVATTISGPDAPTAILALNLGVSTGVLLDRIANRREVAFIALDETELSAGLGISAITRDPQEVGRQAARMAVERIARPTAPARTITLPSTVVRRGSGEMPPGAATRS